MIKYLVDTTILISHLRGFIPATTFLLQEEGLIISYVTLAELLQGAENKSEMQKIRRLVQPFAVHWGSETVNKRALELVEQYHLSHKAKVLDMFIAAIALTAHLTLITDNIRDFQFIPKLNVQKPLYEDAEKAA